VLALLVYVLRLGRALLLLFVAAIVLCYFLVRLTDFFEHIPLGSWEMPRNIALILVLITIFLLFEFMINFLLSSWENH
jgi:predicted PurR-regulated permease PerM